MPGRNVVLFSFAVAGVAVSMSGCLPSLGDLDSGPLDQTFAVSDVYTPSGYMGDGAHFGLLVGTTNVGCKPRPPGARGNCYAFTYYPNAFDEDPWAGVYWVFPANSWGAAPGHAIDVMKFKQVRFYAAVESPGPFTFDGGQAVALNALAGKMNARAGHPDGVSVEKTVGSVGTQVTAELKQFHLAIGDFERGAGCVPDPLPGDTVADCVKAKGADGTDILVANDLVGGFGWSLPYPTDAVACRDGTDGCKEGRRHSSQYLAPQPVRIFLDDIVWDTEPPP
jgi:hypothetical protein